MKLKLFAVIQKVKNFNDKNCFLFFIMYTQSVL